MKQHTVDDYSDSELSYCQIIFAIILGVCLIYFLEFNEDKNLPHYSILGPTSDVLLKLADDLTLLQDFLITMQEIKLDIAEFKLDIIKTLFEEGIFEHLLHKAANHQESVKNSEQKSSWHHLKVS